VTLTVPARGQWADHRHSIDPIRDGWLGAQTSWSSTNAWGTQYRAIYVPVRVVRRVVVRQLGWVSGPTAAGNCDVGIYDSTGTRIVATGSQTNTSASITRVVDITDTTIGPGCYYLGLNNDTTTDTFLSYPITAPEAAARGLLSETLGSLALPSTASWALANTLTFIPIPVALLVTEVS
jgi:hypothetical protein